MLQFDVTVLKLRNMLVKRLYMLLLLLIHVQSFLFLFNVKDFWFQVK